MHSAFIPVTSSNIQGYYYLAKIKRLLITFTSGDTYSYDDIEQSLVTDFINAPSKGTFFSSSIRNKFSFLKVDETELANILAAQGVQSSPPTPRRITSTVSLQDLLLRYPLLNAVF